MVQPGGRRWLFLPLILTLGALAGSCVLPEGSGMEEVEGPSNTTFPRNGRVSAPEPSGGERADPPGRQRPLLLVNQVLGPAVSRFAHQIGAEEAIIIYQWPVDREQTGIIDLRALQAYIKKNVPLDYAGYATLDFELPYFRWLNNGPEHPRFNQAQDQLLGAIRLAKSLRPQAKWTIWGLPRIRYGGYSPEQIAVAEAPAELLAAMDWMAPSIYDLHPNDDAPNRRIRDKRYVEKVIAESRRIAGGRPVLPYVSHRFGVGAGRFSPPHMALVSEEELREHLTWAVEAGVDGVVWWGGDDFQIKLLQDPPEPGHRLYSRYLRLRKVYADEKPPGMSYRAYIDSLHRRVLRLLEEVIAAYADAEDDPADGQQS